MDNIGHMMILNEYQGTTVQVDRGEEVRCPHCDWYAMRGLFTAGTDISIKCSRCHQFYSVTRTVSHNRVISDYDCRCPYCNKLLFKGTMGVGSKLLTRCTRKTCKRETRIKY